MTKEKTKNCSKCGTEYPATNECFRTSSSCKDGISNVCKKCVAIAKKEWRQDTGRYKKGPHQLISFEERCATDSILRRAMILRQGILKRSKEKNLPCDLEILTVSYFNQILRSNSFCKCCGIELDCSFKDQVNDRSPTVDKIVPTLGYVISNIAIICWKCNVIKKDATLLELKSLLTWMSNHV